MSENLRVCFDRRLPQDLRRVPQADGHGPGTARAAVVRASRWPNGSTLRVRFLEGTPEQHDIVRQYAPQWVEHANLRLEFGDAPDAEIRIAFRDDGAWSYIGTDCLQIPLDQPTMNYGWLDEAVVLHEFGHALGLIHEHQNPVGGIRWNKEQVYRDLGGPPNFWDRATVDNNMFRTYDLDQINGTTFDPESIMLYSFPASWTLDGFSSERNTELSEADKAFIGSEGGYPGGTEAEVPEIAVGEETRAEIGRPGEQDLFQFRARAMAAFQVETTGGTDVMLALYGPDSRTRLLEEDDDDGTGLNARIVRRLDEGTYYVQVQHYNPDAGVGEYGVRVTEV
jgi:hypothetical protein